jgi:uncharacterized protein
LEKIRLGQTNLIVSKLGFGGAPLEKSSEEEAVAAVKRCIEHGITFFDTATEYHSEPWIGKAIAGQRDKLVISTKCECKDNGYVENNIKQSLKDLGIKYIDLYHFHCVSDIETYARATAPDGPLAVVRQAQKAGLISHIGITTHSLEIARLAIKSSIFETIMLALNCVYPQAAEEMLPLCRQYDVGFIAMKPLGAGRIPNIPLAFKFLAQYPDIVSIPGIEKAREIDEIIKILQGPLQMTQADKEEILKLRAESKKVVFYLSGGK